MRQLARIVLTLGLVGLAARSLPAAPIKFGPLAKLTPQDDPGGSSDFETEIGMSGDVIVAATFQGHLYIYNKPAGGWSDTGTASALPQPTSADLDAEGELTGSVATSGDVIVAGGSASTVGANQFQGKAYVFVRPPGGWSGTPTETAVLVASDGRAFEQFGDMVAIDGDTIVVSAPFRGKNTPAGLVGGAYVFRRPAGGWSGIIHESAILLASDGKDGDLFGNVKVAGNVVAVGVPYEAAQGGSSPGKGKIYIFVEPGSGWVGTMHENALLTASDGQLSNGSGNGDGLGVSVAIDGDTVVSGAVYANVAGRVAAGAIYVFTKPAGGWLTKTQDAKLTSTVQTDAGSGYRHFGQELGDSVAISGGLILAGAPAWTTAPPPSNCCAGAIYGFSKGSAGWTNGHESQIDLTPGSSELGLLISLDDSTLAAGEDTGIVVFGPSSWRIPSPAKGVLAPKPARSAGR